MASLCLPCSVRLAEACFLVGACVERKCESSYTSALEPVCVTQCIDFVQPKKLCHPLVVMVIGCVQFCGWLVARLKTWSRKLSNQGRAGPDNVVLYCCPVCWCGGVSDRAPDPSSPQFTGPARKKVHPNFLASSTPQRTTLAELALSGLCLEHCLDRVSPLSPLLCFLC